MKHPAPALRSAWMILLLSAGVVSAQTTPTRQPADQGSASSAVEQQIRQAQEALLDAARNADTDAARRIMTEDMTWVTSSGMTTTRDDMLNTKPTPPRQVTVEKVQVLGSAAILVSTAELSDGRRVRAIQEWVNRDGQWRLHAHQGTFVRPEGTAATQGGTEAAATGTSGTAAMHASAPTLNTDDERDVWKAQTELYRAFTAGDAAAYSRLTLSDYVRVNNDGSQQGKNDFLSDVKRNANQSPGKLEMGDAQVTVSGDTARVVMTTWGTLPGGKTEPPQRVTRVFVKRNNQWQQAAAVFTPIAQQ